MSIDNSTGIARLTLQNVERRNSLSGPMMCQLGEAVRSVETWEDGRVLLLSGEGGHFCSGADLGTVRQAIDTPERGALMSQLMTDTLNRLRNLPLLSIAAIDGAAVGGGAELCIATDLRVLSLNATIQFVHTRLGAAPGWGGAARLTQEIGRSSALRLLLLAEKLDVEAIMRLGLAHACGHEGESASDVAMRTIITPSLEVRISRSSRTCLASSPLGAPPTQMHRYVLLTCPSCRPPRLSIPCEQSKARWPRPARSRIRCFVSRRGSSHPFGASAPTARPSEARGTPARDWRREFFVSLESLVVIAGALGRI